MYPHFWADWRLLGCPTPLAEANMIETWIMDFCWSINCIALKICLKILEFYVEITNRRVDGLQSFTLNAKIFLFKCIVRIIDENSATMQLVVHRLLGPGT